VFADPVTPTTLTYQGRGQPKSELDGDDKFNAAMSSLMFSGTGGAAGGGTDAAAVETSGSGISADPTMMSVAKRAALSAGGGGVERWKEMYYREKLELKAILNPKLLSSDPKP